MMAKRCGNCKHSANDLGLVALHCDLLLMTENPVTHKGYCDGKVRSWEACHFKPTRWKPR